MQHYPHALDLIGNTPLVELQSIDFKENSIRSNRLLMKLEGFNPSGSLKDRPAFKMIEEAEKKGQITPGTPLIEATSGNMGIALAMIACQKKYPLTLVMPESRNTLRQEAMRTFGAEIVLTPTAGGMELSRDIARQLSIQKGHFLLDQFANPANVAAHYLTTAPEIWNATRGELTHCLACLGSSGTLMGTARFLKEKNKNIQIIAIQPQTHSHIPGIRKWTQNYVPQILDMRYIDALVDVHLSAAEENRRSLALNEGIFVGTSAGAVLYAMRQISQKLENATLIGIAADRGEKYLHFS